MKFELDRLPRFASTAEIEEEVKRVARLIENETISKRRFDELSKISTSVLTRKFGSWKNVLKACDLEHRYSGQPVSDKMKKQVARNLSDVELISELNRVSNLLGKKELSQQEFNENSALSASAIRRRFDNWSIGLEAAGLKVVKAAQRYSELDYFENLLTVWTHYGRQPKYREMDMPPSKITSGAYERKWGKWTSALIAFVNFANGDKIKNKEPTNQYISSFDKQAEVPQEAKRDIPLGIRYKVLSRDRFRCVKCGNSPASDLSCKLHIDHIIPYSKGGQTKLENLQSSCSNCNLGKGNRHNE